MEKQMLDTLRSCFGIAARRIVCLFAYSMVLTFAMYGQSAQNSPNNATDAIAKVQSGNFSRRDIEEIANAQAIQAIPVLEKQFISTQDVMTKGKIANVLVRLGDKDVTYWNFLVQQVLLAVESDAPDPSIDSQGKAVFRQFSPEFIAWAKAHNVSVNSAAQDAQFVFPGEVMLLGQTGDPRGIPLLRQALWSRNYQIVAAAALDWLRFRIKTRYL